MQLEEFMNVIIEDISDEQHDKKENAQIQNIIDELEMFSDNTDILTNSYTKILMDENVVHLLTRISQNGIFERHFPEFYKKSENDESVINCQQNSLYHKYGVFRHVLYSIEYVGQDRLIRSSGDIKILKWTMLLHDIGKPFVKTTNSEGKDSFAGHEEVSKQMADGILDRFAFTDEEKQIIKTLIKYHDRYLNEGEITYDNLKFLAEELNNKRNLFELLIEVKTADNKAKSIDVYNKWLAVREKYIDFKNEYFTDIDNNSDEEEIVTEESIIGSDAMNDGVTESNIIIDSEKAKTIEQLDSKKFKEIYDSILHGDNVNYTFYPVLDVNSKRVFAYEVIPNIQYNINFDEFYKMAKDEEKYKKLSQLLLVGSMDNAMKHKANEGCKYIFTVDYQSFIEYNNKSRIFDVLEKNDIIIRFTGYDTTNPSNINGIKEEIGKNHGSVCLSDFKNSAFDVGDLDKLEVDFIEVEINGNDDLAEMIKLCEKKSIRIIAKNIDSIDKIKESINNKINLVQGIFLINSVEVPNLTDGDVENIFMNLK